MTEQAKIYYTLGEGATAPKRGRENDFAFDLYVSEDAAIMPDRIAATIVKTNLQTAFDPTKYGLLINLRSGIYKYPIMLTNSTGIIEGDYRGTIGFPLRNTGRYGFSPQSQRVLTIDGNGKLVSLDIDEFYKVGKQSMKDAVEAELVRYIDDIGTIYGKKWKDSFAESIRMNDHDGKQVLPSGTLIIPKGMRIGQAYLVERTDPIWEEVESLSETDRGEGGYGSSGVF